MQCPPVLAAALLIGLAACGGPQDEASPVPGVPALANGTYVQLAGSAFYRIETDGTTTTLAPGCLAFSGADLDPLGVALAVSPAQPEVREVDPVSGQCHLRFATPVPMKAIAVAADGRVVTVAADQQFGQDVMYVFTAAGKPIVYSGVAGDGDGSSIVGLRSVEGMDFGPDGKLYVSDHGLLYADPSSGSLLGNRTRLSVIDPMTGRGALVFLTPRIDAVGDFDIAADGTLRSLAGPLKAAPGRALLTFRLADFSLLSVLQLDRTTGAGGAMVHR